MMNRLTGCTRLDAAMAVLLPTMMTMMVMTLATPAPARAGHEASAGRPDNAVLHDPTRPVMKLSADGFTLQYFTEQPVPTRVQVRRDVHSEAVRRGMMGQAGFDGWGNGGDGGARGAGGDARTADDGVRTYEGPPGERTYHVIDIPAQPGTRYFYRVWAGDEQPTSDEAAWGARDGWRREFALATPAGPGRRTVIRYPVKVLLMTNVVNVASATPLRDGEQPPEDVTYTRPPAGTDPADIPRPTEADAAYYEVIQRELDKAALFFWVNSGMRYWVDFQVVVDDRWKRWGEEPQDAPAYLRDLPVCRSYAGLDYRHPGGGGFTFVDVDDPTTKHDEPIVEPDQPFPGQIEIAFPQRYNWDKQAWEVYTSGGGTLGVTGVMRGVPGRSQYFGGYDTGWLTTHEFHHQMESLAAVSLADREDERIVYNHWAPRSRTRSPDGGSTPKGDPRPWHWSSADRHGEHYDGMAYWDRTLTDAQWLRLILGEAVTVTDADNDGFPDRDDRLPLDEARFGSDPTTPTTDGVMNDLAKALLSTFAPEPLHPMLLKPVQRFARPDPTTTDSDGDGLGDSVDSAPLVPHRPFVWPKRATLDGDDREWADLPLSGELDTPELDLSFKHSHDDEAYYGLLTVRGDWRRLRVVLDGEGTGVYSGVNTMAFLVLNNDDGTVTARDTFYGTKHFDYATKTDDRGRTVFEFSIANNVEDGWYWRGAGREVGVQIEAVTQAGGQYSVYEPYHLFYSRMLERGGVPPMPGEPPAELTADAADDVLRPGHPDLLTEAGWERDGRVLAHGGEESAAYVELPPTGDFDLWALVQGRQDLILGAYGPEGEMAAVSGYVTFVGGYGNTRTRMRLLGQEAGDSVYMADPNKRHRLQMSRREGKLWALLDGKPILWATDPQPGLAITRLAVLGGYGGQQKLFELRYRASPAEDDGDTTTNDAKAGD